MKTIIQKVNMEDENVKKDVEINPFFGEQKVIKKENSKKYIVLFYEANDKGDTEKRFEILHDRKECYDFIKNNIESFVDIEEGKVLTDSISYNEAGSIYEFMKYFSAIFEDDFDIEDYK